MTSSRRNGVLAGGSWVLDRTKIIDSYPAQDSLATILEEGSSNGGGAYNLSVDLARLGAPFPLFAAGLLGDDAAGMEIRRDCHRYGIDTRQLHITKDAPTSYTDVMTVKSTGRRTFFHQRGANGLLGPEHFDLSQSDARIFYLGYLLVLDRLDQPDPSFGTVAASLFSRAREAGLKTVLDLVSEDSDRFAKVIPPTLKFCDYCIVNDFEAERTTGVRIIRDGQVDVDAARKAAYKLLGAGVREWAIIHFPAGAVAVDSTGQEVVHSSIDIPQTRIAGSVGAGDAFAAGVILGIHEGVEMEIGITYGVCAAAACLLDPTTSNGIKPLSDCLKLGHEFGYRPELKL